MPGFVPGIHVFVFVDGRRKPGHGGRKACPEMKDLISEACRVPAQAGTYRATDQALAEWVPACAGTLEWTSCLAASTN